VLFEAEENEGYTFGFTENYVKVKLPYDETIVNRVVKIALSTLDRDGIAIAELQNETVYV
jgi:threonylcarbamoyladenosine tRNA methylthiotransferase MtaB